MCNELENANINRPITNQHAKHPKTIADLQTFPFCILLFLLPVFAFVPNSHSTKRHKQNTNMLKSNCTNNEQNAD